MKDFNFYFPTQITMGAGRMKELGKICKIHGSKLFVVYDPFLKGSDTVENFRKDFEFNDLPYVEYCDVEPNPRNTSIDEGAAICVKEKCDIVVVVGGGSAMDTAKAIALVAVNGGNCWEYTERQNETVKRPKAKGLPLIVIPTTAGTGSEATCYSVINNPSLKRKCTIINPFLYPTVSIIDPEIMVSVPPELTALTAIDTFAHSFEAYISVKANPASEILSIKSIELFAESIRDVYKNGHDIEARSKMAMSCALGGMAILLVGVTLPHALGQPLGAYTDAPHGGALAACLPQVVEWTIPYCAEKIARISDILSPDAVSGLDVISKAAELPKILRLLYKDLNIDVSFSKYGLKEEEIENFVNFCYTAFKQDIDGHPKPVVRDDVVMLVKKCM